MAEPLKNHFGVNLAEILAEKIHGVYPAFPSRAFVTSVRKQYTALELKDRVRLIASSLAQHLPASYPRALKILTQIFGEPNPKETGMFTQYYWLMPVGQFIESNGLEHPELSLEAIYALTQRNTGEYAIRPYIIKYPELSIDVLTQWSKDPSFHVRRLASEGLRPKLPWASKLEMFVQKPKPVFTILQNLKEDTSRFVQKSVANNLNDYLKVNPEPTLKLIDKWSDSAHPGTQWIIKHATRNLQSKSRARN